MSFSGNSQCSFIKPHLGYFTTRIHGTRKVNRNICQELLKIVQPNGNFSAVFPKGDNVVKNELFPSTEETWTKTVDVNISISESWKY